MKWIGIVGSRTRNSGFDKTLVIQAFDKVYKQGDRIVSGGCKTGADSFAEFIARVDEVPILIHYAQWSRKGKSAGFQRNGDIAEDAEVLIACVSKDRTGGTEDTIGKFCIAKYKDNDVATEERAIAEGRLILV